ncbi:MAG: hypothetical protein HY608_04280 [Planctomycetes bacterium]|nr:hypothetical protein [Planctomycetota bacterium]
MKRLLPDLPDAARLWCFHAPRALREEEVQALRQGVDMFLERWTSHGQPVRAAFEVLHGQFLLVGADEEVAPVSGCAQDALVHAVEGIQQHMGVTLVDSPPVCYRERGEIRCVDREAFAALAGERKVTGQTVVFDQTLQSVGDARAGRWETPASRAWHVRAFALAGAFDQAR